VLFEEPGYLTEPELRLLSGDDRDALEVFPCNSYDQPWSGEIERMIREELPHSLEVNYVQGHGLWVGDQLVAADAWKAERDPVVRAKWGDRVWLSVVLAVHIDYRRRGFARRLKLALVERAQQENIVAITSIVSWGNVPMLKLNEELGASRDEIITDVEPDPDFCRCLLPISPTAQSGSRQ
jgi:GNAT superfamily N-acetyltransferase